MDKALHMAAFQKSIRPYKKRIGQIQASENEFFFKLIGIILMN